MYFHAIAFDFDGTLAKDGVVPPEVVAQVDRLKESGRRAILVTGRQLDQLIQIFPQAIIFERIIAENGALIYNPKTGEERLLTQPPESDLVETLIRRNVEPIACGKVIVATWSPHELEVLDAIHELGLEMQVIFNKGAVMILPSGVNKATGLQAALRELGISKHNTVAIGDAENDHAMFSLCECSVAVANALASVKSHADLVTNGDHGSGAIELMQMMLMDDLATVRKKMLRHQLAIGYSIEGETVTFNPECGSVLICGPSGSGKTLLTWKMVEQLSAHGYQFCLIDPERDYDELSEAAVVLGDGKRVPAVQEIMRALADPGQNVVVSLLAMPHADRPAFFAKLMPAIEKLYSRFGRPHWLIADEAHYILPPGLHVPALVEPSDLPNLLLVTVNAAHLEPSTLKLIDVIIATAKARQENINQYCQAIGESIPSLDSISSSQEEFVIWERGCKAIPRLFQPMQPKHDHHRHFRKYAEGDLGNHSFYFTGGAQRVIFKAHNLQEFIELLENVDDSIWFYHLRRHDYSRWLRGSIRDLDLANQVTTIEDDHTLSATETRRQIRLAIEDRYCAHV